MLSQPTEAPSRKRFNTAAQDARLMSAEFANTAIAVRDRRHRDAATLHALHDLLIARVKEYALFVLDTSGEILSWNAGAERLKGYTAAEIIGQHFSIFYPPEEIAAGKPTQLLGIAVAEGQVEDEGWRVRKDGTRFWARVLITALRNDDGELVGFAKVTRDLSGQREAAEAVRRSEERFR